MAPIPPQSKKALGTVLVTGGCGFLGYHIVKLLLESYNCRIAVVDLRTSSNRPAGSEKVAYFDCDITNNAALLKVFEEVKPDAVIHAASPNGNDNKASHPLYYKVNVEGTKSVIEACRQTNVKALIYTCSASVISDNETDLINADERWPVLRGKAQTDYYSETKAHAEQLVLAANRVAPHRLLTCSIRPAGLFGEFDPQMTPSLLTLYYTNRTGFQLGDNDNLFDFTYAGNVAHAHVLAVTALLATHDASTAPPDHEKVDGEAFLITNDSPIYFWDLARMFWREAGCDRGTEHVWRIRRAVGLPLAGLVEAVCKLLGVPTKFTRKGFKLSCMTRYYNISKARARLGYRPLWTLQEGVRLGTRWDAERRKMEADKKGQ